MIHPQFEFLEAQLLQSKAFTKSFVSLVLQVVALPFP